MKLHEIGVYVFYLGVLVALAATFTAVPMAGFLLLVLGLVVGFLNISEKETSHFLLAAVALLLTTKIGWSALENVGPIVGKFLGNVELLVGPAALVVALIAIWKIAKEA